MHLNYSFMLQDIPVVLKALIVTLKLTFVSYIGAILIGLIFGAVLLKGWKWLQVFTIGITTVIKGIPLVIQLLFCYYAIPYILKFVESIVPWYYYNQKNPAYFAFAAIAFSINYGAYMTDVVVSSFKAVNANQMEAAYAVGMSYTQGLLYIVGPQAFLVAIPGLGNYFMWLLKATSLASIVNVFEMLSVARASTAENYAILEGYIVAAAIYWIVCIIFERLLKALNAKIDYRIGKERGNAGIETDKKTPEWQRNIKRRRPVSG